MKTWNSRRHHAEIMQTVAPNPEAKNLPLNFALAAC